jgi:hypothetical protein
MTRHLHRRVLILADESAAWKIAGLPQLDRLLFSLGEFAQGQPLSVCVSWDPKMDSKLWFAPAESKLGVIELTESTGEFLEDDSPIDLVLSTHLFLYRSSLPRWLDAMRRRSTAIAAQAAGTWETRHRSFQESLALGSENSSEPMPWKYLSSPHEIAAAERSFLKHSGKTQDGLVSRYLNRPVSRSITRWLLKLPLLPSTWSLSIFALPLVAAYAFLQGTYLSFIAGCAIFQIYSILDGCDGEIARAKFCQTEFGRRLDSLCDLIGNLLLALCLGLGLDRQADASGSSGWFYTLEGMGAAALIVLSEGIVFLRRARPANPPPSTRWNDALYQRHHEFLERSGILFLGEKFAWWLVQLTKRDMAMLVFLLLAIIGQAAWILHLLLLVSAITSAMAGFAFLRQPAPSLPQEAS